MNELYEYYKRKASETTGQERENYERAVEKERLKLMSKGNRPKLTK